MKTLDYRSLPRLSGDNGAPGPRGVLKSFATGDPVVNPDGTQATLTLEAFLLERTGDPKFCSHGSQLEGYDAIEVVTAAREAIKRECAKDDGLVVLEDNHASRLAEATLKPGGGYNPALQHCLWPLVRPAKSLADGDLRIELGARATEHEELKPS